MSFIRELSIKNISKRPVRSAVLILLSALLTISVFAGTVVINSLQNGLESYGDRLGADVIVVPYQNHTKNAFESILLQGLPGTYSMQEADYRKILETEGIKAAAPQFYLASTTASCCSVSVQIIGFDPDLDFTVQPWIKESYDQNLGTGDVIVGSRLTVPKDHMLSLYDTSCRIVAQLDETGTGLDTAVYANMETIKLMIENAKALGFTAFDEIDPDHAVSSVMIKAADGVDPETITNDINIHVRHVKASSSAAMLSGIASGLSEVSGMTRLLVILVWIFAAVILAAAYVLSVHQRRKEFAVLRVLGASRKMVSRLILTESLFLGGIGALCGLGVSAVLIFLSGRLIQGNLELPYLLPAVSVLILLAAVAVLLTIAAGAAASAACAYRMSRQDTAFAMREGA